MIPTVNTQSAPPRSFVVMLSRHGTTFMAHSDHPAIPTSAHNNQVELEQGLLSAARNVADPVEFRWATGVSPTHVFVTTDEAFLAADKPATTYKTVPGTERLPATSEVDPGDGTRAQADAPATDAVRNTHRSSVRVVALGQVYSPSA